MANVEHMEDSPRKIFRFFSSFLSSFIFGFTRRPYSPKSGSTPAKFVRTRSILVVTHDCHPHGAQFLTLEIARQLDSIGFKVSVLALGDGRLLKDFVKVGPTIIATKSGEREVQKFLSKLRKDGVRDAITSTVVSGSIVASLKKHGFRILSLVHELPKIIRDMKQEENAKCIAQNADKVVFAAETVRDNFCKIATVPLNKSVIRPQGLLRKNPYKGRRNEAHDIICKKYNLPPDTQIVLNVGYADFRKGPDLFVEVAAHVLTRRPDTTFIWVGHADNSIQQKVNARICELGIESRVLFAGFDPYPMAYYAAAAVYALTSREDPFPNVVIESIEAGVPVVAFEGATGAADYIAEHGGSLAKAEDTADFAKELCSLLEKIGDVIPPNSVGSMRQYVLDLLHSLSDFPRISIIVPNYNYNRLITQRLDSIFHQSFPIYEIIILDDASSDNSVETIKAYLERNDSDAWLFVNERNSGSVFRQWRRGVRLSKGDLVWIAEADDLAEKDFLSKLVSVFEDPKIVLAYSQSKQIDEAGNLLAPNYLEYTKDISDLWQSNYTRSGLQEIAEALTIKNTIVNVSAVVFRRSALQAALEILGDDLFSYKVAGDWLIYLHVLTKGWLHFCSEPLNWHRRHTGSVTKALVNTKHYEEVSCLQKIAQSLSMPTTETLTKAERYMDQLRSTLS